MANLPEGTFALPLDGSSADVIAELPESVKQEAREAVRRYTDGDLDEEFEINEMLGLM